MTMQPVRQGGPALWDIFWGVITFTVVCNKLHSLFMACCERLGVISGKPIPRKRDKFGRFEKSTPSADSDTPASPDPKPTPTPVTKPRKPRKKKPKT